MKVEVFLFSDQPVSNPTVERRREVVFLCLAGLFLGSMTMLNIIGITKFLQLGWMSLAVGVLPYPLTFLCTDILSEFYGRRRANLVVSVGLGLNLFVLFILWLGSAIPAVPAEMQPPWQVLSLSESVGLPNSASYAAGEKVELFQLIYACTAGAVLASMIAYVAAQFCDVWLFHFFKKLTNGKHLWLRNNGSTLISQGVDSFAVVTITFGAAWLEGSMAGGALVTLFFSNYAFKFMCALVDTIPFYGVSKFLRGYLEIDPSKVS